MTELLVAAKVEARQRPARMLKLMIVDPMSESRSLLRGALRNLKQIEVVRETGTPKNIMELVADAPLDLIMIDQNLGDENVYDVVKHLKSQPATANVKFVLMSSALDMESRRKGMEAGILGYLAKPYDLNSLERSLRDALGRVSTNHKDTLNKVRRIEF